MPTSVDATDCPITRFREPFCHSCCISVQVVRNNFPVGRFVESGSAYEKVALGPLGCTALDEDMVCVLRCKQGRNFLLGLCEAEVESNEHAQIVSLIPTRMPSAGQRLPPTAKRSIERSSYDQRLRRSEVSSSNHLSVSSHARRNQRVVSLLLFDVP